MTNSGQFKKGQSGNPKGAPKKEQTLTKCLEKAVDKLTVELSRNGTVKKVRGKEVIAQAYINIAFDKNNNVQVRQKALEFIWERLDGKARQQLEVKGDIKTQEKSLLDIVDMDSLTGSEKELMEAIINKTEENE